MIEVLVASITGPPVLWALAAASLDRHGNRAAAHPRYDLIAIPGCRVMPDGRPSHALARRVRLAAEQFHAGLAPQIVCTGGLGEGPCSEAATAGDMLVELGVPRHAVILEDRSTTTEENARFAAELAHGDVLVVTDCYHAFRCQRMFGRHFRSADAIGAVPADPKTRARMALREALAVLRHGLAGRL